MRLDKIQTQKEINKPSVVKISEGYAVCDINKKPVKVFEDIDVAKTYLKRHLPELKEGKEPVVYVSEIMEGVLDDTDDDGWMAKSELYKLAKYAIALHGMIEDTDNLEPWVASKITKASDYISTVKHYMEYVDLNSQTDMHGNKTVIINDLPDEEI